MPVSDRVRTPYEGQPGRPWDPDDIETPLRLHRAKVPEAWVDYNDHMSESCYLLVMGDNADAFFRYLGIDEAYREAGQSLFTVETHLCHLGEADLGDEVSVSLQVLSYDAKRVHIYHELRHTDTGALLATGEQMLLHMDTGAGRTAPLPAEQHARVAAIARAHAALPRPERAGRAISGL